MTDCCDVVRSFGPRGDLSAAVICTEHQDMGWVNTYRGPDYSRQHDCGCVDTTLYEVSLSRCATHTVGALACCQSATRIACVCAFAYNCPTHGMHHYGSHD